MLTDDGDLEERRTRSARNQTVFREVNERIVELSQRWTTPPQFICECENPRCAETITATMDQYEAVRGDPGCFLVARGHEVLDVEEIVDNVDGYVVVRTLGQGLVVAVDFDPRKEDGRGPHS
jgi:hypothetical protein